MTDQQIAAQMERDKSAAEKAALQRRLDDLEAQNKQLREQVTIATKGEGIPSHVISDIGWRIQAGLKPDQARDKAIEQWQHDLKLAAEAEAKRPKTPEAPPAPDSKISSPQPTGGKKTA